MYTKIKFITLAKVVVLIFLVAEGRCLGQANPQSLATEKQASTFTLCDLASNSKEYDGKLMRIRTNYLVTFESKMLYDLNCNEKSNYAFPWLEGDTDKDNEDMASILRKVLLASKRFFGARTEVTMLGIFKVASEGGLKFGHQQSFRLGFAIDIPTKSFEVRKKDTLTLTQFSLMSLSVENKRRHKYCAKSTINFVGISNKED